MIVRKNSPLEGWNAEDDIIEDNDIHTKPDTQIPPTQESLEPMPVTRDSNLRVPDDDTASQRNNSVTPQFIG